MRVSLLTLVSSGLLLASMPALAAGHPQHVRAAHASLRHATLHGRHANVRHETSHRPAATPMPTERATEIQTALISRGYLSGEPTGSWDAGSVAAMQKLQGDNGWQTKITPDSRALIKLGLGPQSEAPLP